MWKSPASLVPVDPDRAVPAARAADRHVGGRDHGVKGPKVRFLASLWGGIFAPGGAAQLEHGEAALFAVHGDTDPTVPVTLDDQLIARARRQDVRNEYHRIQGGAHGYDGSGFFTREVVGSQAPFDRLLRFANKALERRR
jgi:dienelactone hydrolase